MLKQYNVTQTFFVKLVYFYSFTSSVVSDFINDLLGTILSKSVLHFFFFSRSSPDHQAHSFTSNYFNMTQHSRRESDRMQQGSASQTADCYFQVLLKELRKQLADLSDHLSVSLFLLLSFCLTKVSVESSVVVTRNYAFCPTEIVLYCHTRLHSLFDLPSSVHPISILDKIGQSIIPTVY